MQQQAQAPHMFVVHSGLFIDRSIYLSIGRSVELDARYLDSTLTFGRLRFLPPESHPQLTPSQQRRPPGGVFRPHVPKHGYAHSPADYVPVPCERRPNPAADIQLRNRPGAGGLRVCEGIVADASVPQHMASSSSSSGQAAAGPADGVSRRRLPWASCHFRGQVRRPVLNAPSIGRLSNDGRVLALRPCHTVDRPTAAPLQNAAAALSTQYQSNPQYTLAFDRTLSAWAWAPRP